MSTQSIASSSASSFHAPSRCATCGASIAGDQRYCLECGERQVARSEFLRGAAATGAPSTGGPPRQPPAAAVPATPAPSSRNNTLSVIAGVGVLLLAMGVGVLIGRSGAGKQSPAPAQVVSIASAPTSATTPSAEASFTSDWPTGTSGYTVQLQTLPQAGSAVSAVEAAKSAASAKGAKGVGALESEEFSSLSAGSYVIYSGVDHKKGDAEKALASLKKSFPTAKVIKVANSGSAGSRESSSASGPSKGGVGSSESKPAPPSVLENLKHAKGKSYEEKSKNLPDVVSTG